MLNLQLLPPLCSNPCYALVPFLVCSFLITFVCRCALAWKLFCIFRVGLCVGKMQMCYQKRWLMVLFVGFFAVVRFFFVCNSLHFNCYFYISICNLKLHSLYSFAFNIANNATPTSAKTASHIVAKTTCTKYKTITFTANAKMIFCQTIFWFVCLYLLPSVFCSAYRLVSLHRLFLIVASLPKPPIAIPTSLNDTTGASFTPSPTKHTVSFFILSSFTLFTLSSGNKSPKR